MSAATTAAHSGRGHMAGESHRQESVTMDMLEVSITRSKHNNRGRKTSHVILLWLYVSIMIRNVINVRASLLF